MIQVTGQIALHDDEVREDFVRASGPGGQKVNKASTAVQLRFDAAGSPSLPGDVKLRLLRLAGRRATSAGEIVIDAQRFRSHERNRADALNRLIELIRQAARRPAKRRPTRPSAASNRRRLESKRRRSQTKQQRRPVEER